MKKVTGYYLKAIKLGNSEAMNNLELITTPLERYILYKQNDIKFEEKIEDEEKINKEFQIYQQKLRLNKKNDQCNICLKDNIDCIPINWCGHYLCSSCYIKLYDKPCLL